MNYFQEPVSRSMEQERSASRSATAVIKSDLLLKNIMTKLPARHLLRLSLVDTRWRRLTSGPNFLKRHTRHHSIHNTSETSFIIHTNSQDFYFNPTTKVMAPCRFRIPVTRILQSSHGLMLLECRDSMHGPKYYCVANPTTRRPRKLSIKKDTSEEIVPFFLKFDPSESEYYKVGFMRVNASRYHTLDVYDSETREWEQRPCPDKFRMPYYLHANTQRRICMKNGVFSVGAHGAVLYIDVDKLIFGSIRGPSILYDRNYVMEWNRSLYCICIHSQTRMLLHKLKATGVVWKQILRVDLNRVYCLWPEMKGRIAVLGMRGLIRDKDASILFTGAGMIVAYRLFDESFELLFDLRSEGRQPLYLLGAHQFKESFALV